MANLIEVVRFPRPQPPDDTAWMRKAATDFSTIATRWGAIDGWRSATTPARPKLDVRRVPPPSDEPWMRQAELLFDVIGARWGGLDPWENTVLPIRKMDP